MTKKLKHIFTENLGIKLAAILFAVGLWLVVVNVDDPNQTKAFTTKVVVINDSVLTSQGKYYTIPDNQNTVTFRVTGRRSVMERLTGSDFTATADLSYLMDDNKVPISISADSYASSVTIANRSYFLNIIVGNQMTKRFVIDAETTGTPVEGCAVQSASVSPNVVTISGPEEAVSEIAKVVATANVDGIGENLTETVIPVCLSAEDEPIDTTGLNLTVSSVNVNVSIVSVKTVSIKAATGGIPAEGLIVEGISVNPSQVEIIGPKDTVNNITEIIIPPTVIDFSTITDDLETTVDITAYLPSGVSVRNAADAQVKITVNIASALEGEGAEGTEGAEGAPADGNTEGQ